MSLTSLIRHALSWFIWATVGGTDVLRFYTRLPRPGIPGTDGTRKRPPNLLTSGFFESDFDGHKEPFDTVAFVDPWTVLC